MKCPIDVPGDVRAGEGFDEDSLRAYLEAMIPGIAGGEFRVRQFPSGFSNLTYLVCIGDRELVMRRPPFGTKPKSGHDMGREFHVLSALQGHFPYAPRPLAYCRDAAVIGCEFYVMERMKGLVLRMDYPQQLAADPALVRSQNEALVDALADLHSLDVHAIGLSDLGRPAGYVERQIAGWSRRYAAVKTPDAPDCDRIVAWLGQERPAGTGRSSLIHNDYKLDNVVWDADDPGQLAGVLDWEMATLGEPLMDLGCTLAYWVEKHDPEYRQRQRMTPTNVDGALTRREFVHRYGEQTGLATDDVEYYYCFGLFRCAVIVQQIYYRYYLGETHDPRFGALAEYARILARAATEVIEGGGL